MRYSFSWKAIFKAASADYMTNVAVVTERIQTALGEIMSWIMGEEAAERSGSP